jgi:tight adherence protein C
MTAAFSAALLATLSLGVLYRALVPKRAPLAADLARLLDPLPSAATEVTVDDGRLVSRLTLVTERRGWISGRVRQDLLVVQTSVGQLITSCLKSAVAFGCLSGLLVLVLSFDGLPITLAFALPTAVLGAVAGALVPPYLLKGQAEDLRAGARRALPGLLDLAGILLAAGNSLESALRTAASSRDDWIHRELRESLYAAALTRQPAADAVRELGIHYDIPEVTQLGDGLTMAEREGASMRQSLAARSKSLRERQLADVEAKAGSATEGMSFPLVAFVVGFVLLIGYPAVVGLSAGLGSS